MTSQKVLGKKKLVVDNLT